MIYIRVVVKACKSGPPVMSGMTTRCADRHFDASMFLRDWCLLSRAPAWIAMMLSSQADVR